MKTSLTILILFLTSNFLTAQVEELSTDNSQIVGISKYFGNETARMYKVDLSGQECYLVAFDNNQYKYISDVKGFSFCNLNNDFENLFDGIAEGFKNKAKEKKFKVRDGQLTVKYAMGTCQFWFVSKAGIVSSSGNISKKGLAQLFGKKFNKKDF
ncbi:hypothetical protein [Roseivirga pacifica]